MQMMFILEQIRRENPLTAFKIKRCIDISVSRDVNQAYSQKEDYLYEIMRCIKPFTNCICMSDINVHFNCI